MFKSSISREAEHIFYNVSIINTGTTDIPAEFLETRKDNIVDEPDKYNLTIAAFTVPTQNVPIFTFVNGAYSVTLQYQDTYNQAFVQPYYTSSNTSSLTGVFQYQDFLDCINKAFSEAYDILITSIVGSPPAPSPPFLIYDTTTELFSLVAHIGYSTYNADTSINASAINIYMNSTLANFFIGTDQIQLGQGTFNGKDTQFIVKQDFNVLNWTVYINNIPQPIFASSVAGGIPMYTNYSPYNPPTTVIPLPYFFNKYTTYQPYYVMSQQQPSTVTWYSARTLQITTNTVPIRSEFIPAIAGNNNTRQILTDFQFNVSNGTVNNTYTQYTPSLYRLIDLTSNEYLKTFDCKFWYTDDVANITPLTIPPGNTLNIKYLFIKKVPIHNSN